VESGGVLPTFQSDLISRYSAHIDMEVAGSSRASLKFYKTAQSVIPEATFTGATERIRNFTAHFCCFV